jgi:hypothetical protein
VSNVKRLVYRWVPDTYEAQTVMGTINPVGFRLPHKWIVGELHVLSEAKSAMDSYVKSDAQNVKLASMVATQKDANGTSWTYTFTDCYFLNETLTVDDGKDVITVYPFVAKKVETATGA